MPRRAAAAVAAQRAKNNTVQRLKLRHLPAIALVVMLMGCSATASAPHEEPEPSVMPRPTGSEPVIGSIKDRGQLASAAAAAKDKHFTAEYTLTRDGQSDVTVRVMRATDGTWRIDIPKGLHGGKTDVTMAWNRTGYYQCVDQDEVVCVNVADKDGKVPSSYDPRVQHVFTDWLDVLLERNAPLAVTKIKRIKGASKDSDCFSLRRNSVRVSAEIPDSVYCIEPNGTITAVDTTFGKLRLDGELLDASPRITLPGKTTNEKPLGTSPPPKPSPSKSNKKDGSSKSESTDSSADEGD